MLKNTLLFLIFLGFFSACSDKEEEKQPITNSQNHPVEQRIKESILASLKEPEKYKEIAWKTMLCSDIITRRINKNALFIAHTFQSQNIFKGPIVKEHIYFIGNAKPSLLIDFDIKLAFEEFLSNPDMGTLFTSLNWDFSALLSAYKQSQSDKAAKEKINAFIYGIYKLNRADQDILADEISKLNTPMSRANNYAIFIVLRLFPELMEELLWNEISNNQQ
jgi:hypothetical protein